jgi:hypothetical protein
LELILVNTRTQVTNLGWVSWEQAIIYDNACNPIGYYNNPYQGIAIDSQLPYTVVLMTLNTEGYYDTIGMAYAGYSFTGILLATVRMDPLGITTTTYVMLSLVMDLSPTKRVNFLINLKLDPFSRPSETLEGCLEVMLRR